MLAPISVVDILRRAPLAFFAGLALPISTAASNLAIALVVLVTLYDIAKDSTPAGKVFRSGWLPWIALAVFVWAAASLSWSQSAPDEALKDLSAYRKFLFIPLFMVFFTSRERLSGFVAGFLCATALSLSVSVAAGLSGIPIFPWMTPGDWSTFHTHTYHSFFIILSLFLVAVFVLPPGQNPRQNWMLAILVALVVFDIFFLVKGRTAYVIFFIFLLCFMMIWRGWWGVLVGIAVSGVLLVAIMNLSSSFVSRALEVRQDVQQYAQGQSETSVGLRLEFYKHTWELVRERPLLGYGVGDFAKTYQAHTGFSGARATNNPHNDYLMWWFKMGVMGALLLVLVYGALIRDAFRGSVAVRWASIALAGCFAVSSLANSFVMDFTSGHAFALFAAALLAYGRYAEK